MKHSNTSTAPCAEWAEKLAAAHPDDLSISERAALEKHIATCPACATARSEYLEMDERILGLPPVAPLAQLPSRLIQTTREHDDEKQQPHSTIGTTGTISTPPVPRSPRAIPAQSNSPRIQRLARLASAIAAVLVVGAILGGFLLLFNSHHTSVGGPVTGAVVYVASEVNDGTVYAVRPSDGALYWQNSLGHKLTGALAVSKDAIFTGSYDGSVYALRKSDGSLLWQQSIPGGVLPPMLTDGTAIYFSAANAIYALRTSDGSQLWRHPARSCNNCAGAVVAVAGGTVYAFSDGLYALRAGDGKTLWHDPTLQFTTRSFVAMNGKVYVPAEREGRVYVLQASNGSHLHTLTVQKDEPIYMVAADGMLYIDSAGHDLYAVQTSDDTTLWHKQFNDLILGLSGVSDGNLYFAASVTYVGSISILSTPGTQSAQNQNTASSTSTDVYALRISDGSQRWHWHSSDVVGVSSQLLPIGGQVYFTTGDGLYALRSSDGSQLWHVLQGKSLTDPVAG